MRASRKRGATVPAGTSPQADMQQQGSPAAASITDPGSSEPQLVAVADTGVEGAAASAVTAEQAGEAADVAVPVVAMEAAGDTQPVAAPGHAGVLVAATAVATAAVSNHANVSELTTCLLISSAHQHICKLE